MPNLDAILESYKEPQACQRCGMPKAYHKTKINGKVYINCIRKKPYKLRDAAIAELKRLKAEQQS